MQKGTTLFQLRADHNGVFDGSNAGIAIQRAANVKALAGGAGITFAAGVVEVARNTNLDDLEAFTIEATIKPARIGPNRQNILEAQSPGIALFLGPEGKLLGSLFINGVWTAVDSGTTLIAAKRDTRVSFTRDETGTSELTVDGRVVGSKAIPGAIGKVGEAGLRIGAGADSRAYQFNGVIGDVTIRQGAVTQDFLAARQRRAQTITASLAATLPRVRVSLVPDESHARLQPIKDIMNAAGVQRLSDLQTLRITTRTVMSSGTVMVAARAQTTPTVNWAAVATEFRAAAPADRKTLLASVLANQNSQPVLARAAALPAPATPARPVISPVSPIARVPPAGVVPTPAALTGVLARTAVTTRALTQLVRLENRVLHADPTVLQQIVDRNPANWPTTTPVALQVRSLTTIPVSSAVIIAGTLDLTDTQLVVEPNVKTLYIIAERVICENNASITWRRPGGVVPARADDPSLNGRTYSGVHPKPNSRDGLDGGNGGGGATGLTGSPGVHAPNLEMWVKNMTGLPNLDLNGEDGLLGGRGQRGGRGGNGADGQLGERWWFFGWHCSADPGDGGDGGDGGRGGSGGRGGNGGNGGKITVGVLDNTLETTVTNRAFKIKNQEGRAGRGGAGGSGGVGGAGGRSGVGETCRDAENGHAGAQGQPGAVGPDGFGRGVDGLVEFFEFSEDAWDDLLTRPWLSEVSPTHAFPGDNLTLRGSRITSHDTVFFGGSPTPHTVNADESVSITVPLTSTGGEKVIYIRRADTTESNRISAYVKPQLEPLVGALNPGSTVTLTGRAFRNGASALINGGAFPATVVNPTQLTFVMPNTSGDGSASSSVTVQIRNPDGLVSNTRTAQIPRILEVPFRYGQHNLSFDNFTDGVPDWGTYETTFGSAEVWHEQLDPIFGHPVLTAAFYFFYEHFLKGKANGGLATGFCTSLAGLVADRFWQGRTDTPSVTKASVHKYLTAIHGKLLSRESLIHFHDQGRQGAARVDQTYREIEATFLRGCDRNNAPLLFFIPSGAIWDSGYFDKLADSHCVMPYRFLYPAGREPQLAPGGVTTLTNPDGVEMYVWDCNNATSPNCRLKFRRVGSEIRFDFFSNSNTASIRSEDGVTLGMMTLGDYLLADHDLPFSGPFGLTTFIIDFLLSPADLQVTDGSGRRTGRFGTSLVSEIPNSRPCYLIPGAYMLPDQTALTRRIVGNAAGTYAYHSIMPSGGSLALESVTTAPGQEDVLAVSADANQVRFTPAAEKTFALTLARTVGTQARALAITGAGGAPTADVDVALSPDLSLLRVGNRGAARSVQVRAFSIDRTTNSPANRQFASLNLPANHDLTVAVTNWTNLDASVETLPFQ
jgi:hypothetical protein